MKKLTLMLAIMFAISALCIPVNAVETGPDTVIVTDAQTYEFLTEMAIHAFPEYEAKIRGEHLTNASVNAVAIANNSPPSLVVSETRRVSDTTLISYQEYDNGVVITSGAASVGKNVTNTSSGTGYSSVTMNMWLNVAGSSQTLLISGVQYTYQQYNYGAINNPGSVSSVAPAAYHVTRPVYIEQGSATSNATLTYQAAFDIPLTLPTGDDAPITQYARITLIVYSDSMSLNGSLVL